MVPGVEMGLAFVQGRCHTPITIVINLKALVLLNDQ